MESLLSPLRAAGSRPARRAYITTLLLASSSLFLLFLAASAYILFYFNYIPRIGIQAPIHLQYAPDHPPTGRLTLSPSSIIPHQAYAITLHLHLPSTPSNIALGNFMLDLTLTSGRGNILSHSRRPAIMTYRSPLLETLDTLVRAPLLLSRWQRQEERLSVTLLEDVTLSEEVRDVKVAIEVPWGAKEVGHGVGQRTVGQGALGVYSVDVEFRARFGGVRWIMYNYRVLSFLVATALFWGVECVFMAVVWWLVYNYFSSASKEAAVPGEGIGDGADTDDEDWHGRRRAGYPTPESTPGPEADEGDAGVSEVEVYADDEEEEEEEEEELVGVEAGVPTDSGLGSMSESASSARARAAGESGQRRRSRRRGD